MNTLPLALYLLAAAAYGRHFVRRSAATARAATTSLGAAVVAHTFVIGMQTMQLGHVPLASTPQTISAFVWLLALSYLYTEMTTEERAMGVFITPLLVALQTIPAISPGGAQRAPILESLWLGVHVSFLLFAYASFALGCVIGVTYILLFKEIKAKHLGFFYTRLPSLHVLDAMNMRAVAVGWVCLTIGVVVGGIWVAQIRGDPTADPRVQAMSMADPKIFVALVCWAVYSFELYARRAIGWRGRRAAWLSAIGFAIVLLNLVPVSYFLTTSHSF